MSTSGKRRSNAIRALFATACAAALVLGPPRVGHGDEPVGFLEVAREGETFSVEAEEVPLVSILREVGELAGFAVEDPAGAGAGTTVDYFEVTEAPLDQALGGLLARANHLVVYRGETRQQMRAGAIQKIILLRPTDPRAPRVVRKGVSPLAGPVAPPTRPPPELDTAKSTARESAPPEDDAPGENADGTYPADSAIAIELALEAALDAPDGAGLPAEVSEVLRDIDPALAADMEEVLNAR